MTVSVEPLGLVNREPWTEEAACRGLWWLFDFQESKKAAVYEPAIRICQLCPVFAECARYADASDARGGVWAGVLRNGGGGSSRVGRPRKAAS